MRFLKCATVALLMGSVSILAYASVSQAQSFNVSVEVAPPPLPVYEQPPIPGDDYIWIPGYWARDASESDYYWVPGTWAQAPEPDDLWTPAYWAWQDGAYVFFPGYWAPQVGFYGGIDYGYGYNGRGYAGGRWDHGQFFVNRAINNIEGARLGHVYEQRGAERSRETRVSFNGGNGGVEARPTPQDLAVAREKHLGATPLQVRQAELASKTPQLFSKRNHGEPSIAATPKVGTLAGAGVIPARRANAGENARTPTPNGVARPENGAGANPNGRGAEPAETGTPTNRPAGNAELPPNSPRLEQERQEAIPEHRNGQPGAEPPRQGALPEPPRAEPRQGTQQAPQRAEPRMEAPRQGALPEAPRVEPRAEAPHQEPRPEAQRAEAPRQEARPQAAPAARQPEARPEPRETPAH